MANLILFRNKKKVDYCKLRPPFWPQKAQKVHKGLCTNLCALFRPFLLKSLKFVPFSLFLAPKGPKGPQRFVHKPLCIVPFIASFDPLFGPKGPWNHQICPFLSCFCPKRSTKVHSCIVLSIVHPLFRALHQWNKTAFRRHGIYTNPPCNPLVRFRGGGVS